MVSEVNTPCRHAPRASGTRSRICSTLGTGARAISMLERIVAHSLSPLRSFSGCTMYDTYFGGYHSLRQIIYGVIVAVASISALVALFDAALKNNRWMLMFYGSEHGNEALTFLAISFFFTMLGLAWGFGRTPFSTTELLMIFLVWCVLVYCYDLYVFIGLRLTRLGLAWLDSLLTSCYRSMW